MKKSFCMDSQYNMYLKRSSLATPSVVEVIGTFGVRILTINYYVTDPAGIDEQTAGNVAVWPNPTKGIVKIEAENIQNISIFNILGEIILETSASGDAFEYDFSKHEAGLYFIKVETAQGVNTEQVTVL